MQLRPLPAARWSHAALGAVAAIAGVGVWVDGPGSRPVSAIAGALLLAVGIRLVIRSRHLLVECRSGVVHVHGLLLTRRVPRSGVQQVTGFPALVWRDASGRRRWTPVVFLADSPRALGRYRRHNTAELARLRRWIDLGAG